MTINNGAITDVIKGTQAFDKIDPKNVDWEYSIYDGLFAVGGA